RSGGSPPLFFQAEDGIRDDLVTGVQTCALPILGTSIITISNGSPPLMVMMEVPMSARMSSRFFTSPIGTGGEKSSNSLQYVQAKIGRASCREREEISVDCRVAHKKRG